MMQRERNSDGVYWLPAAHLDLNFRDFAPPLRHPGACKGH